MPVIANLVIRVGADTSPLSADLGRADRAMEQFATDRAGGDAGASAGAGGDASAGAGGLDPSAGPDLRASLLAGLSPLNSVASRFADQFNRVGGTITTLARRIDGAMKAPQAERMLDSLQAKLRGGIASAAGKAAADLSIVERATRRLGPAADVALTAYRRFGSVRNFFGNFGDVAARPLDRISRADLSGTARGATLIGRNFATVAPAVNTATTSIRRMGAEIGLALGVAGLLFRGVQAGIGFFRSGVQSASDLNESMSKTKEVFGEGAMGPVIAQADEMSKKFGLAKGTMLDAAASIGLIGNAAGQTKEESAGMANTLAAMAADASSFYNVPLEEALAKIKSGLVGEAEPMRAFGVLLSEEAVKAEAAALGFAKHNGKLDEQSKVAARASLIMKGLGTASGDLERTADSPANMMRKISGQVANLGTAVGVALLPAISGGLALFSEFAGFVGSAFESSRATFEGWMGSLAAGLETVGVVFRNFGDFGRIAWLTFLEGAANVLAYVEVLPQNLGLIAEYIGNNWSALVVDGVMAVGAAFANVGANIGNLWTAIQGFLKGEGFSFEWTPLLDGFRATAEALPELVKPSLVSMQDEIDAVGGRIAGREEVRAIGKANQAKGAGKGAAEGEAGAPSPSAVAESKSFAVSLVGSQDFASAIARHRNQGGADDDKPIKDVARNSQLQLEEQKKMNASLAAIAAGSGSGLLPFPIG